MGIRKKWDGICQQHHFNQALSKGLMTHQLSYQSPRVLGFQPAGDRKTDASCDHSNNSNESSKDEPGNTNVSSGLSTDFRQNSSLRGLSSLDALSKANNQSISSSKSGEIPSESKGLGIISASTSQEPPSCFDNDNRTPFAVTDPKSLYKALVKRVPHQDDAINSVVETITQCQTKAACLHGVTRRSIWLNCQGPDTLGKKKLGIALAETLYGTTESLIYVDLSFQDKTSQIDTVFISQVINKYDITMRGTVVDYLVEKLSKKPSVVFIENIDRADMVVQNSLSQGMKTDRITDLQGREVTISNCVFLVTTNFVEGNEENVIRTKGSQIQILIRFDLNDDPTSLMNKRKLIGQSRATNQHGSMEMTKKPHKAPNSCLDLNLPAKGSEVCNECDSDSSSDNSSKSWQEDFNRQINRIVVFKPFDFDTLAEKVFNDMSKCLHNVVGSECSMEIEPKVMQQLVAAAYLFGNERVEDWNQRVLRQGFVGAKEKFSINVGSIVKVDSVEGSCSEGLLPSSVLVVV